MSAIRSFLLFSLFGCFSVFTVGSVVAMDTPYPYGASDYDSQSSFNSPTPTLSPIPTSYPLRNMCLCNCVHFTNGATSLEDFLQKTGNDVEALGKSLIARSRGEAWNGPMFTNLSPDSGGSSGTELHGDYHEVSASSETECDGYVGEACYGFPSSQDAMSLPSGAEPTDGTFTYCMWDEFRDIEW